MLEPALKCLTDFTYQKLKTTSIVKNCTPKNPANGRNGIVLFLGRQSSSTYKCRRKNRHQSKTLMLGLRQFGGPVISSGLNKKLRPDRDEPLKLKDGHLELPKISTTKEQAA